MYPAQTSFIPIHIALAKFLESQGWRAIFSNYPYWYLGTTPFRYLTGPILPIFAGVLHRLFPFLSLFEIILGLVGISWVIGGIGVYWLVYSLHHPRSPSRLPAPYGAAVGGQVGPPRRCFTALLATFFYLFGPIVPFLFRFTDGIYLIAFSLLPFTLLMYLRLLRKEKGKRVKMGLVALVTFVILLDSAIIPTMILGMAAIFLAQVGWRRAEEKLKQTLLVLSCSFLVATLWYTPGYWLTLLGAPSLGGIRVIWVIGWLGKLLPIALAFGIAVFSVKFFKKKNLLRDFCFYWLFIFGFLSFLRFLSDPDFWLDWSAYGTELQLGVAIALGLGLSRIQANRSIRPIGLIGLMGLIGISWAFLVNKYVVGTLQPDITQTVEYRIGKQLSQIAKPGERVFLSGTTAFWLNSFFDISQVRGGVDQASVYPTWRQAVWEIREGRNTEDAERWLRTLNASYLVVHTEESEEFYHDFTYPEKFEGVSELKKVYDEDGDRIYRVLD